MIYKYIKILKKSHICELILARSEKRNAFNQSMVSEIHHAFENINYDDNIKLVIVKAEGPIFCAGMDLKTFTNPDIEITNESINYIDFSLGEVFDKLYKPSLAIVEGDVYAGGFLIILGCNYVYCDRKIKFKLPELDLGLFPFQVLSSLLKVMPVKQALQLCMDTSFISAKKAKKIGIIDNYLDKVNLESFIESFANKSVQALISGIKSAKEIQNIAYNERYSFMKKKLDNLKRI